MTCLIITRNRPRWLECAIQCVLMQRYSNKELLIVADGQDVRGIVPDESSYIHLAGATTCGEKRNFGCERACGDLIAFFDDDDYSAPSRLEDQVGRLLETGKSVTGYCPVRFTDGRRDWMYRSSQADYAVGASLCFRKDYWQRNKFPPDQVGEDVTFVKRAQAQREIVSVAAGDMMYATIHPGNTSPRPLNGSCWVEL